MSTASVSHAGRLGNLNIADLSLDPVGSSLDPMVLSPDPESGPCSFESWSSKTNDFKIDTCRFLVWRSALLG